MERIILLKTQLAEAAKFANAADTAHQRLAIILLDNFVEIQLSALMRKKFSHEDVFTSKPKQYAYAQRVKILHNYDDLLKAAVTEKLITPADQKALTFCHEVRNRAYHIAAGEHAVIAIAIAFLQQIVMSYQPQWRSGRDFMSGNFKTVDPFAIGPASPWGLGANDEKEWSAFLDKYFIAGSSGDPAAGMIADYLSGKVRQAADWYNYFRDEYSVYAPDTKDWQLNDFVKLYSFFERYDFELKVLKEESSSHVYNQGYAKLMARHVAGWKFIRQDRLATLEEKFKAITRIPAHQALEKYVSHRSEIELLHSALGRAASAFDQRVEESIEYMREMRR
ncbi:hypothetical protein [Mucilaginibacter flavus]|uniref:hypothetical protein n=1 Tax=Mucilaginibacter flavus TaxID=931504 RepID=UPI0025B471EB|nr:hypothetical protein [Mucilaginibacter flavus]MDN3584666.1 hypothetical protein [Mucilaginibacter flavus]